MMKAERFLEHNRRNTYYVEWLTEQEHVNGNIVIVHGMAEHVNRYEPFASYANAKGYNVMGFDQRGHGFTSDSKVDLGMIDEKCGWDDYVNDLKVVVATVRKERPDEKIFLFGHSMGSFVSRDFSIHYSDLIDGLILSGSTDCLMSDLLTGLTAAKTERLVKGRKAKADRVNQLLTSKYAKPFKNRKTDYDWLSSDAEEVKKYIADSYAGFCPKTCFFTAFFSGLISLHEPEMYKRVPKALPVLLLSGQQDPVTNMGLGTIRLFKKLQSNGVKDIRMKLYPGMRHEILNESEKLIVYRDIVEWVAERSNIKVTPFNNHNSAS